MKTSQQQFQIMVTFMEQHGDLSRRVCSSSEKISILQLWEELTYILNSDGNGDSKTTDKWKKVWSDFKNNTKKKAAKLNKAGKGVRGTPVVNAKLSDLEHRVLELIGSNTTTGLNIEEEEEELSEESTVEINFPISSILQQKNNETTSVCSPTQVRATPFHPQEQSILSEQTTRRRIRRPIRNQGPYRRIKIQSFSDQVAEKFLRSESEWRKIRLEQLRQYIKIQKEKKILREIELENQKQWNYLGSRALQVIENLVTKFCKD